MPASDKKRKHFKYRRCPGSRARGFTLIETLVAVSILLLSIAGPMTIASKGLSSAVFARDQITAFYLAQEAIEYIRNRRDENFLKGSSWLYPGSDPSDLSKCISSDGSKKCTIDVHLDKIAECLGSCPAIKYSDSNNFYGYERSGYLDTKFTRSISIREVDIGKEAEIEVTMSWFGGIFKKTFSVKENIYNWR